MPIFAGDYVRDPSDFLTVTTERGLIEIADDPGAPTVPDAVDTWAQLTAPESAALAVVLDKVITRKEGIINGYLRGGGYATPVDPDANAVIVDFAVQLVWIDRLLAKEQITREEYAAQTKEIVDQLVRISNGTFALPQAEESSEEPASGTVYGVSASERIFSRETLEEF